MVMTPMIQVRARIAKLMLRADLFAVLLSVCLTDSVDGMLYCGECVAIEVHFYTMTFQVKFRC